MQRPRQPARHAGTGEATRRTITFEWDGALVVREPALFRPGQEAFGRRLADAAGRLNDVQRVEVGLATGTCRIEFAPGRVAPPEMATRFAESVRTALSPDPAGRDPDRDRGWTALTVFPAGGAGSTWETIREDHGDLRLRNHALRRDRGLARRV